MPQLSSDEPSSAKELEKASVPVEGSLAKRVSLVSRICLYPFSISVFAKLDGGPVRRPTRGGIKGRVSFEASQVLRKPESSTDGRSDSIVDHRTVRLGGTISSLTLDRCDPCL